MSRNPNRRATIRHTRAERRNVASLMAPSQPQIVVLAVYRDVVLVALRELLDRSLDRLDSALLTHRLGGVVGVAAGTVPLALERLGVEGDFDAPLLSNTDEQETRHPEVVAHIDSLAGADLELPLGRHDLGVDTRDVDARVEAGPVVRLDQVTRKDLAGSYTRRVRSDASPD